MDIHPYFINKARAALRAASGNPDNAEALARWAQDAKKHDRTNSGVIVAEDGEVIAETKNVGWEPTATYVINADRERLGLFYAEVGFAMGEIRKKIGKKVILVRYGQVCVGRGDAPELQEEALLRNS